MLAFWWMLFKGVFETLRDHNLGQGLSVYAKFDTLTLLQGHMCVRIINCMDATHIKKIKHSMLCVTGVYLRTLTRFL